MPAASAIILSLEPGTASWQRRSLLGWVVIGVFSGFRLPRFSSVFIGPHDTE